ncbi:M64 family metallo-endopeptidase [Solirubrobacter ginsenosidimutans]|uniref:M64 family metallo-endopeptidase n=1 Tax=Solirubrobacter ginsenosidimutans TaxID=490573 RepID=A0A9X3MZW3_9ACTN|nr:M64 family metallopeptidase [Solirubrobacter ginsenosidimutans]MDA0165597.1 M64 family metallo-endopeptidase [Solirubrobacter ginsenosidimutans]
MALLAVASAIAVAAPAQAQTIPATGVGSATVVPLQVTGPAANRFNLVIAGDGYTEAEQDKFMAQVDKHLNVMWSIEPYKSYRNYINVYAIKIISGESGISCDSSLTSPRRTTPLSMAFWGGCSASSVQRLVTVNNSALSRYTALAPGVSQRLAIGNSNTYGGAGGANATATGGNSMSALISPHEIGHSLGGLQDEYDYYTRGVLGGCYTGGEPSSIHHTLLTIDQMLAQQKKWWRWIGEPSEAGGLIGRYEGGMYFDKCVWRPSQHSIMKTLGYYYDQVSREVMTRQISSRVKLVDASTPTTGQVGNTDTLWLDTQHPVDHQLNVTWSLDGTVIPNSANLRNLKLGTLALTPGATHTVTAKVSDPTTFVRDPTIQNGTALTQTLTWTVKDAANTPGAAEPATIVGGTQNERAVGRNDVVYAATNHPADGSVATVTWKLDGAAVPSTGDSRFINLAPLNLTGTHTLTATTGDSTRTWIVDATDAETSYTTSTPTATVSPAGAAMPEYIFEGPFSLKLTATDDKPGYVVPEFRVDGDGWQNFYGWPTDANAPFQFSSTGTDIDALNYGKLAYGHHVIEYRAIDASGNIATAKKFALTYLDPEKSEVSQVAGTVPATLSLSLGATPPTFGAFTPGLAKDYTASMSADVITSAGDAALSVADPSTQSPGKLVNGTFSLPAPLLINASSPSGTGGALGTIPSTLLTYGGPVSHDPVTVNYKQTIGANDALRTGAYSKTLTFTLSTTTP